MARGAIYGLVLIVQFWVLSAVLLILGVWKLRTHTADSEGQRGTALWLSFVFAATAILFDGLALLAVRAFSLDEQGSPATVGQRCDIMLICSAVALGLGVYGRGTAKLSLIGFSAALIVASRALLLAFLTRM